jgi:hypothetical protein
MNARLDIRPFLDMYARSPAGQEALAGFADLSRNIFLSAAPEINKAVEGTRKTIMEIALMEIGLSPPPPPPGEMAGVIRHGGGAPRLEARPEWSDKLQRIAEVEALAAKEGIGLEQAAGRKDLAWETFRSWRRRRDQLAR